MPSLLTTLERPSRRAYSLPVLAQQGFTCTTLTLDAGTELTLSSPAEQLLYVLNGEVAVVSDAVNTIVASDHAHLLAPHQTATVAAQGDAPARVLRIEVPPRRSATADVITLSR